MPLPAAVPVKLTAAERKTLKKRTRGAKTCWRDRVRAQIVLLAAWPLPNAVIARRLGLGEDTVRKWRGRFAARGLGGLDDLSGSGRPRQITAAERAAICALACQLPAATGVPLARWSGPELATEVTAAGLVRQVSPSPVLRILAEHPIKPWQHQSWIYPRDEDFEAKAKVVLDLYQGYYHGEPLGPGDRVLSVGRQAVHPGPQALPPNHPRRARQARARRARIPAQRCPGAAGRPRRAHRRGLRLHPGDHRYRAVHGADGPGHDTTAVQQRRPGVRRGRQRLGHRGEKAAPRLPGRYPNPIMIHTPGHASWLNQVEIFFSIIQKKAVTPDDVDSTSQTSQTLLAFIGRYNQTARPFNWKFTADDLTVLLARITAHENEAQQPALPEAA